MTTTLADFQHRAASGDAQGRDVWMVRAIERWMRATLPPLLASVTGQTVLDAGCGAQPFRPLIEQAGCRYVGMDIVQNDRGTVDVVAPLDAPIAEWPRPERRYPVVICTEVLSHVGDVHETVANLRRLTAPSGAVVITTPFVFPLNMEPYDYRRLTDHGIERLAAANGFRVERVDRFGSAGESAATLIADLSILPTRQSPWARARVAMLRLAARRAAAWLERERDGIAINGHLYLGNGAVLRAADA
jgi:SAM-dependent methyltransferase